VLSAPELSDDARFTEAWRAAIQSAGYRSLLVLPLESAREAGGGAALVLFEQQRTLTDDDLALAEQLTDAARGGLERSELFEAERHSRALAQQLARTGSLFTGELEPAAVLDEVVEQAPALLRVEAACVRLLEGGELTASSAVGAGADDVLGTRVPVEARPPGAVITTRTPVAIPDVTTDERLVEGEPLLAAGYAGYLGVPLFGAEGGLQGVLAVLSRAPRIWREEEIEALGALAANASVAFASAELYQRVALERERSIAILANVADGIVAVDRNGEVVLWNAAAEAITGVPSEEALGRTPLQVLQRELQSDGAPAGVSRLVSVRRGDHEVWLSLSEAVMRDPSGAVAGRIFAFRDISAERVVEEMRSDFVSTVSHELRAPLTSIYGFAATLLREDVEFGEEERRTFLTYVASEAERLTAIVDKLLNVARLDAGDLQVQVAPVDVGSLVAEVIESMRDELPLNGHRFVLDLPDEPIAAQTDADKLRQVLSNLVDNAVKFSPDGGTVTVGATVRGETIVLRVSDEGIGIPEPERDRIFRKFYRAGAATVPGGTGLGLFIVQGLLDVLGGKISVTSAEGAGSSFVVELPAAAVVGVTPLASG
jgi:PAS domain S-box-containing protein